MKTFHKDGTLPHRYTVDVFVFGSNEAGIHGAGAALAAKKFFGAVQFHGVGLQGRSYAIPTKDRNLHTLPLDEIKQYVDEFVQYTHDHPYVNFFVTAVGCGLAKQSAADIAPMFNNAINCSFPDTWQQYMSTDNETA